MMTCPECGQSGPDDARFCERCGRGVGARAAPPSASTLRSEPLKPGATLKGGFEIIELISSTSLENRYRAARQRDGAAETFQLRERLRPQASSSAEIDAANAPPSEAAAPEEDPAGPRAKTAELKPPSASSNGPVQESASTGATGGLEFRDRKSVV